MFVMGGGMEVFVWFWGCEVSKVGGSLNSKFKKR